MFVLTERNLRGLIAPINQMYSGAGDWMQLDGDELTTYGDIYRTQPAVRSVVDFIAGHAARMPIKLFKQEGGGTGESNEGDREHMRRHPAQKLLNVPSGTKQQGRASFWTAVWKDFLIYDRYCLVKIKDLDSGSPIALVRVPPMWFAPTGGSYFYPEAITIIGNRGMHDIPIGNVVYGHGYDPADPRIGASPMLSLKSILEEEAKSIAWRNRFWSQGVQASMVVSRPVDAPEWDDGARDRFIESLRAASSRGRPLLLEEGMSVNPAAAFNPQSAQYIQSKQFTREEVLRVYNLPVGLFEQQTSANIAQYRAMLYAETLAPLLGRFVDDLESQLLTEWFVDPYDAGMYLEPAIDEKLRGNIMEQIAMFTAATGGPIMLRDEARAFMNLKTLTDDPAKPGKLIIPSSAVVDGEPAGGKPPAPSFGGGGGGFGGVPGIGGPTAPKQPANQNGPAEPPQDNDTTEREDRAAQREGAGKSLDPTRRVLTKARGDEARRERLQRKAAKRLAAFARRQAAAAASAGKFDKERWDRELAGDLSELRQEIATEFGEEAAAEWGAQFDPSRMEEYNTEGSKAQAEFINGIAEGHFMTYHELGEYAELGEKLVDVFTQAATDTVNAMAVFGAYEAAKSTGQVVLKAWRTLSSNPRPSHAAVDGEEVPLKDTFSHGLRYPHDPAAPADETAGCQCEIEFSVSDEERPADEEPE